MKKNFIKSKLMVSQYRYELIIFIFLMIKLFKRYWSLNSLLGLSLKFLPVALLLVVLSMMAGKIIRDSDEKVRGTVLVLTAFFLVSYVSNSVLLLDLWHSGAEAFKNTLLVLSSVLAFVLIDRPKVKWIIPILCFAGIAIQPFYTITFLPMVIILFVYKINFGENRKENKDLFASTLIASVLSFLLFGLKIIPGVPYVREEWVGNLKLAALSVAIIFPFFVLTTAILVIAWRKSSDRVFRHIMMLIMLEPCFLLLTFCTVKTNMNLVMSAVFVQLCLILYFTQIKNSAVVGSCERINGFIDKNLFTLLLTTIYLASSSSFYKMAYSGLMQGKDFYSLWS